MRTKGFVFTVLLAAMVAVGCATAKKPTPKPAPEPVVETAEKNFTPKPKEDPYLTK